MIRLVPLAVFVVAGLRGSGCRPVHTGAFRGGRLPAPVRGLSRASRRRPNASRDTLQAMTSTRILRTLDFGAMMTIAYQLNREEREAVARFLGKPGAEAPPPPAAFCRDRR